LFDDFKGIRRTTGHRAHRVQLIDDEDARSPHRSRRSGKDENRRLFEIEANTQVPRACRRLEPVEPESKDWGSLRPQQIDHFYDAPGLAGTCLAR
jgi:hypothetical protein